MTTPLHDELSAPRRAILDVAERIDHALTRLRMRIMGIDEQAAAEQYAAHLAQDEEYVRLLKAEAELAARGWVPHTELPRPDANRRFQV